MSEQIPMPPPYPWKRPIPWVTWTILVSTIAAFLFQLYEYHTRGYDVVGDTFAFSQQALDDHRYWTLITYAWAHAVAMFGSSDYFWVHIATNMIALYCLGPAVEECLGPWRYLGLYIGGAIAAALFWLLISSNSGEDDRIIGASGAVFALIAAAGTVAPRERVVVYLFYVLPLKMTLRTMALVICGAELAQAIFGWLPEIAHSAHLGGAFFGFLYIVVLRYVFRKKPVYG